MPIGPKGQRRPADVIGAAVMIGKIATGEITETERVKSAAAELGSKGGKARAAALSKTKREAIAKNAAAKRWKKETT